ncbi:ENDUB protein, partial [Polypterus senegalus]
MNDSDPQLSVVAQELWDNDVNRLQPGKDYKISLQGKAGFAQPGNDGNDGAFLPLFAFVDENIFKKETFHAFISLLDNYESDAGEPEVVTPEEEFEIQRFLDSVMKTPIMKPDGNKHIMALQFSWKNGIKPKGSIFIGVSPEFEFALYTLCFLTSPNERVKLSFSLYEVEIVCHHYNQKHIGTTYPVLIKYL